MTVEISYFSVASLIALVLFLGVMIPRSLFHLGAVILGKAPADRWLVAIAVLLLMGLGLSGATALWNAEVKALLNNAEPILLSFLVFAAPGVLQVLRAWNNSRRHQGKLLSHALVALAILSLPASMAVPTAALMQSTAPPQVKAEAVAQAEQAALEITPAEPATAPASIAFADDRFFTDNEVANDPADYPIAAWLSRTLAWHGTIKPKEPMVGEDFGRDIPAFTAFWIDQTTSALSFDAADTYGVLVSRITHVRANLAFSTAVFLYKLLCALVLAAVTYDAIIRPLVQGTSGKREDQTAS